MHLPPLPATKGHCGHCPAFVTVALTHSFYLFPFFPRGDTWNSSVSLTDTNPLVCVWSPANDLKQCKQDLWKKISCHISAWCCKQYSHQKKKSCVCRKSSYIPLCSHLGLSLQEFAWYFFWQGSCNFIQVYLNFKQTNKKTKTHTKCATQQTVECMVQYPLLSFSHITLPIEPMTTWDGWHKICLKWPYTHWEPLSLEELITNLSQPDPRLLVLPEPNKKIKTHMLTWSHWEDCSCS